MNQPKYSQLKRFGLVLIFAGFGLIPFVLVALAIFGRSLDKHDYVMAVAGLMWLVGSTVAAGAGLLVLHSRFSQRGPNSDSTRRCDGQPQPPAGTA